jgi:hypothetical protein
VCTIQGLVGICNIIINHSAAAWPNGHILDYDIDEDAPEMGGIGGLTHRVPLKDC